MIARILKLTKSKIRDLPKIGLLLMLIATVVLSQGVNGDLDLVKTYYLNPGDRIEIPSSEIFDNLPNDFNVSTIGGVLTIDPFYEVQTDTHANRQTLGSHGSLSPEGKIKHCYNAYPAGPHINAICMVKDPNFKDGWDHVPSLIKFTDEKVPQLDQIQLGYPIPETMTAIDSVIVSYDDNSRVTAYTTTPSSSVTSLGPIIVAFENFQNVKPATIEIDDIPEPWKNLTPQEIKLLPIGIANKVQSFTFIYPQRIEPSNDSIGTILVASYHSTTNNKIVSTISLSDKLDYDRKISLYVTKIYFMQVDIFQRFLYVTYSVSKFEGTRLDRCQYTISGQNLEIFQITECKNVIYNGRQNTKTFYGVFVKSDLKSKSPRVVGINIDNQSIDFFQIKESSNVLSLDKLSFIRNFDQIFDKQLLLNPYSFIDNENGSGSLSFNNGNIVLSNIWFETESKRAQFVIKSDPASFSIVASPTRLISLKRRTYSISLSHELNTQVEKKTTMNVSNFNLVLQAYPGLMQSRVIDVIKIVGSDSKKMLCKIEIHFIKDPHSSNSIEIGTTTPLPSFAMKYSEDMVGKVQKSFLARSLIRVNNYSPSFSTEDPSIKISLDESSLISAPLVLIDSDGKHLHDLVKMVRLVRRDFGVALLEISGGKRVISGIGNCKKLDTSYQCQIQKSDKWIQLQGAPSQLQDWVFASKDPRKPGTFVFEVGQTGTDVHFIPKQLDQSSSSINIPGQTLGNVDYIFAAIGGDQKLTESSVNFSPDVYLFFLSQTEHTIKVFIGADFDITKINVNQPGELTCEQIGARDDTSVFCPIHIVTCAHDDRFYEVTNSCGEGDNRIIKFYFPGFDTSSYPYQHSVSTRQQIVLDNFVFYSQKHTVQETINNILFCPTGDEFWVYNTVVKKYYSKPTYNSNSIHRPQLKSYGFTALSNFFCIREVSSFVVQGVNDKNEALFAFFFGNMYEDARLNVHSVYNFATDKKLNNISDNFEVSMYADSLTGHSIVITFMDSTSGNTFIKIVDLSGFKINIEQISSVNSSPFQINKTPMEKKVTINLNDATSGKQFTSMKNSIFIEQKTPLELVVLSTKPAPLSKSYVLDELAYFEGSYKILDLKFEDPSLKGQFNLIPRVSKVNQQEKIDLQVQNVLQRVDEMLQAGEDFFVGIQVQKGVQDTSIITGYLVALFDNKSGQVSDGVVLNSNCRYSSAAKGENYAVALFSCAKGVDYYLRYIPFLLPGRQVTSPLSGIQEGILEDRVDAIQITHIAGDKFLVAFLELFWNVASFASIELKSQPTFQNMDSMQFNVMDMQFVKIYQNDNSSLPLQGVAMISKMYSSPEAQVLFIDADLKDSSSWTASFNLGANKLSIKDLACRESYCSAVMWGPNALYFQVSVNIASKKVTATDVQSFKLPTQYSDLSDHKLLDGVIALSFKQQVANSKRSSSNISMLKTRKIRNLSNFSEEKTLLAIFSTKYGGSSCFNTMTLDTREIFTLVSAGDNSSMPQVIISDVASSEKLGAVQNTNFQLSPLTLTSTIEPTQKQLSKGLNLCMIETQSQFLCFPVSKITDGNPNPPTPPTPGSSTRNNNDGMGLGSVLIIIGAILGAIILLGIGAGVVYFFFIDKKGAAEDDKSEGEEDTPSTKFLTVQSEQMVDTVATNKNKVVDNEDEDDDGESLN